MQSSAPNASSLRWPKRTKRTGRTGLHAFEQRAPCIGRPVFFVAIEAGRLGADVDGHVDVRGGTRGPTRIEARRQRVVGGRPLQARLERRHAAEPVRRIGPVQDHVERVGVHAEAAQDLAGVEAGLPPQQRIDQHAVDREQPERIGDVVARQDRDVRVRDQYADLVDDALKAERDVAEAAIPEDQEARRPTSADLPDQLIPLAAEGLLEQASNRLARHLSRPMAERREATVASSTCRRDPRGCATRDERVAKRATGADRRALERRHRGMGTRRSGSRSTRRDRRAGMCRRTTSDGGQQSRATARESSTIATIATRCRPVVVRRTHEQDHGCNPSSSASSTHVRQSTRDG